ncbi:MAG TPA: 4-hydroxybenzoate octaprenyltransferase [Methylococcus sp.]|nr:4-hydroxybenzoate octaprenyltransferase [Methylococcus sp.]
MIVSPSVLAKIRERGRQYWYLMRFDKPVGIFLLLWPALWALWIAGQGHPDFDVLLVIVLGVILMRAAGCVINDYADRGFDPHVERTRSRPLAAGQVSPREALVLFVVLCLLALLLVSTQNRLTIALSVPGAFLAASYPFMKRVTYLPQAYLGLAFGWAVPMAFAAQTNSIPGVAWELYAATALWALIYDTMYAMVDRDDDLRIGVKSTAILFGELDRVILATLQVCLLLFLFAIGQRLGLGLYYHLGLGGAAWLAIYQQALIQGREKEGCFRAFRNNHWFGATIFVGLFLDYALA